MRERSRGMAPPGSTLVEDAAARFPGPASGIPTPPDGFPNPLTCTGTSGGPGEPLSGTVQQGRPAGAADGSGVLSAPARPAPIGRPVAVGAQEPSWGTVLATTIRLWTSRRIRRLGLGGHHGKVPVNKSPSSSAPAIEAGRRSGRRWRLAALTLSAAVVALAVLLVTGTFAGSSAPAGRSAAGGTAGGHAAGGGPARGGPARGGGTSSLSAAAAARTQAATWIARQVSGNDIVACDPVMCAALQARGVAAGRLLALQPTAPDPLGADLVVATPAIRSHFGDELAGEYAPAVIASFGAGPSRVDVRAIAPDGAAAYRSALRSDLAARKTAGAELLRNSHLRVTAPGTGQLRAGDVDSRLLVTLATLVSQHAFNVTSFSDAAPGARAPLREVTLTSVGSHGSQEAAGLPAALRLVRAQRAPYLPAQATIVRLADGRAALRIEFAAPSPMGLLSGGA